MQEIILDRAPGIAVESLGGEIKDVRCPYQPKNH